MNDSKENELIELRASYFDQQLKLEDHIEFIIERSDKDPEFKELFRDTLEQFDFKAGFLKHRYRKLTLQIVGHCAIDALFDKCMCPICIRERGSEWLGNPASNDSV